MIIAIDGPSGTGKSTVARRVAKELGVAFFDTGAMYRSAAWWILRNNGNPDDEMSVADCMKSFRFEIEFDSRRDRTYLVCGTDVTNSIRTHEISTLSSKIAAYPGVRAELVKVQRAFGEKTNAVFEGRDMGTVVFPEADVKVFLTAKPQVRAERRYLELLNKFPDLAESLSREQILKDIEERDHNDSTRAISPLKKADDAVLIDTSDLTIDEVVEKIVNLAKKKNGGRKRMRFTYGLVYWSTRIVLKLFYGLKIYGLSHFRPGAAIIAPNHASNFDPPVVSISCPEEVHFLAKDTLFQIPLLGRLIKHLNTHPVSREASDAATFRLILSILQNGEKVILFPEGKRTFDGELLPIERGLPFLMMKAKCRVQPVYVQGTFQVWPRTKKFPKLFGKIKCVFGSPIEWEEFEGLEKREAERKIQERIGQSLRDLKLWAESGSTGLPP